MFKILKGGTQLGMTEALSYIKKAKNGCYILCSEPEASGIVFSGTPYQLAGRPEMGDVETVTVEEADAGTELQLVNHTVTAAARLSGQMEVAARRYVQAATDIDDSSALSMPDLFKTWAEVLAAGTQLTKDTIINDGGVLYRVVQPVTPQEHQPPHSCLLYTSPSPRDS